MSSSDLPSSSAVSPKSIITDLIYVTGSVSPMSASAMSTMGEPPASAAVVDLTTTSLGTTWTKDDSNTTLSHLECQLLFEEFKKVSNIEFDRERLIRVLLSWTFFLISAIGNGFVLTSVTIRRRRRAISHSQLMMMHLTIANLLFTVFIIPLDAIWQTTIQWYGGEVLCRLMNVLKQFAMYSSSAMVVVMGIDRAANLMCPMSIPGQRRRIRTMLIIAWIFCALNAIPAGFIFSVVEINKWCPHYDEYNFVQCVDLQVRANANLGAYYVYTMLVSFFGPLVCILICYLLIALAISKMARLSKEAQKRCLNQRPQSSGKSVTRRGLDRARRVSLIVTGLITFTFIICWGPYYVTGLIEWFGKEPIRRTVRDVLLMFFYLNPMLHPLITVWLMKEIRQNILTQCRTRGRGSSTAKTPNRNHQPIVVNLENNGLLQQKNGNGAGSSKREWL